MPDYEQVYRAERHYFGSDEADLLARFAHLIPEGGTVLDIGVGQGRNALPLARTGRHVTGIDPSPAAIEVTGDLAAGEGLEVSLWCGSFEAYEPGSAFDAVLAFGLLQELTEEKGLALCSRMRAWCEPGGLVFVVAWHVGDSRFDELKKSCEPVGERSFRLPSGEVRTYLDSGQVLDLFPGWEAVHHWEGLGPKHYHGDGVLERHSRVELVARKPPAIGAHTEKLWAL